MDAALMIVSVTRPRMRTRKRGCVDIRERRDVFISAQISGMQRQTTGEGRRITEGQVNLTL
jgi:hypothetical protein